MYHGMRKQTGIWPNMLADREKALSIDLEMDNYG